MAWNEAAEHELALVDPDVRAAAFPARPGVQGAARRNAKETTGIFDDRGERIARDGDAAVAGTNKIGALVLVRRPERQTGSVQSYRHLIGAMAHELRTPLTAILGHVDILGSCDPEQDEALWRRSRDFIASEAERLARLVEDLLTLSRLDLTPLQHRPVNLRAVAEEAISFLFQTAEARDVRLSLQSRRAYPACRATGIACTRSSSICWTTPSSTRTLAARWLCICRCRRWRAGGGARQWRRHCARGSGPRL